jgi:putative addiction module killer protein
MSMAFLYQVLFWQNPNGDKPVAKWLKSLSKADQLHLGTLFKDLAIDGPLLHPKTFKHLEGDLWEMRDLRSPGPGYRVYFGWQRNRAVCLVAHGGDKGTQKRDIELAKQRLKQNSIRQKE